MPMADLARSILSYYDTALKGKGKSTASQTAWGLIGLLAVWDRTIQPPSAPWHGW